MTDDDTLPIFPLGTVLFPDGVLALRVFEARYLDMVSECLRRDAPFGVCLITRGGEVGEAAEHEAVGCEARIMDWDAEQSGVLLIRARGGRRLRVLDRKLQPDRLIRASVERIEPDADLPVPDAFGDCVELLRNAIDRHFRDTPSPNRRMVWEPCDYDSAAWVGNRLSELLPIAPGTRQKLMALTDPLARLALVAGHLRRQPAR
ncbi:MAG: hypothetical protein RIS35_2732 [Pseudomonadota bacterium]|jgi:Lon protease-like protein